MKDESGPAKKSASFAIASGVPNLFISCRSKYCCFLLSGSSKAPKVRCTIGVYHNADGLWKTATWAD